MDEINEGFYFSLVPGTRDELGYQVGEFVCSTCHEVELVREYYKGRYPEFISEVFEQNHHCWGA